MLQPRNYTPVISEGERTELQSQMAYNADNKPCEMRSFNTDIAAGGNNLKEPEQSIEGGRISISSAYSQGWVYSYSISLFSVVHFDIHDIESCIQSTINSVVFKTDWHYSISR